MDKNIAGVDPNVARKIYYSEYRVTDDVSRIKRFSLILTPLFVTIGFIFLVWSTPTALFFFLVSLIIMAAGFKPREADNLLKKYVVNDTQETINNPRMRILADKIIRLEGQNQPTDLLWAKYQDIIGLLAKRKEHTGSRSAAAYEKTLLAMTDDLGENIKILEDTLDELRKESIEIEYYD